MYTDAQKIQTEIKEKEMTFQTFLIKYGEIAIKGKNRYMFEDALVRQIRFALRNTEGTFRVHKCQGRIYVDCDGYYDYDETVESLKRYSGLSASARLSGQRSKSLKN